MLGAAVFWRNANRSRDLRHARERVPSRQKLIPVGAARHLRISGLTLSKRPTGPLDRGVDGACHCGRSQPQDRCSAVALRLWQRTRSRCRPTSARALHGGNRRLSPNLRASGQRRPRSCSAPRFCDAAARGRERREGQRAAGRLARVCSRRARRRPGSARKRDQAAGRGRTAMGIKGVRAGSNAA
jgi:hypothetical protein